MFDLVLDNLKKATDVSVQLQQEMFRKWFTMWPGIPSFNPTSAWTDKIQHFNKEWASVVNDLVKNQRETMETQFKTGLANLEEAFRLGGAKDISELQAKTMEFWQKGFDFWRKAYETQMKDYRTAISKWTELFTKSVA